MQVQIKPLDLVNQKPEGGATELKWGDLTADDAEKMKLEKPSEYAKLYRAEFGIDL